MGISMGAPDRMYEVGRAAKVSKTDGDVSVTATDWTAAPVLSLTVTLSSPAMLMVAVQGQAVAPASQSIHLTAEVDGVNIAGPIGMVTSDQVQDRLINFSVLTDTLAAGSHTLDLKAKVTGGTGTVRADAVNSAVLGLSAVAVEGSL